MNYNLQRTKLCTATVSFLVLMIVAPVFAQEASPSGSIMASTTTKEQINNATVVTDVRDKPTTASMFAVQPPKPREFKTHDLIEIIVRETSRGKAKHQLKTIKEYSLDGDVSAWPNLRLDELLKLQFGAGPTAGLPSWKIENDKEFKGKGDYKREDDLTARLTAEIIDVLPNGNLILEAKSNVQQDEEILDIKVTGICRPDDITANNTILSHQLHDLKIEKVHEGRLKNANKKGFIGRILDGIFAF